MATLVEQVGVVGLEEEDKEAVVAVDGALEGFEFEASDDLIAGVVPGLGEIGVAAAPAVDGGSGDASPAAASTTDAPSWRAARNLVLLASVGLVSPSAGVSSVGCSVIDVLRFLLLPLRLMVPPKETGCKE